MEDASNTSFGEDAIHFHENKSTIMSNFEEWIKLSTDNKITSKNSWQFALIDYFHDLNVIKDGDNINFQRASATLDGCVKIYLSRVESAASETGKLLSGLATKKGQTELESAEHDDESDVEADADPVNSKKERRINRVVESTLVPFLLIEIKKLDQELAIDPLFKKALADFDEGGAKSLLLNTLNIDSSGRVVFDTTTIKSDEKTPDAVTNHVSANEPTYAPSSDVNFTKLRTLLGDASSLESLVICPSMKDLKTVLSDVNKAKTILGDVNSKLAADDYEEKDILPPDEPNLPDYDIDLDMDLDDNFPLDEPEDADRHANAPQSLNYLPEESMPEENRPEESIPADKVLDGDLMAYFDDNMKTNWRGPEHWRVAALKKSKNLGTNKAPKSNAEAPAKAKKNNVLIDFFEELDEDHVEKIFQKPKNQFQILIKPEDRVSEDLYILPDDIKFNSQKLVNLFLKPSKNIRTFVNRSKYDSGDSERKYTDQNFFADKYRENEKSQLEEERQERLAVSFHQAELEDYDNDNYEGIDFNDVLGGEDGPFQSEEKEEDTGTQVVAGRKARPEYVNFSRVAKRVDVKLLKDNLWRSIKQEDAATQEPATLEAPSSNVEAKRKDFKHVVDVIGKMYRPEEKQDLSTSFCFICLLHLANEHGLSIEATEQHDNLLIGGF